MKEIDKVEYQDDEKRLIIRFKGKNKPQIIPIKSLIKDLVKDTDKRELERAKDFDELSKVAEKFINKWGCPHSAVIVRQGEIEFLEGVCGSPLKILD